MNIPKIIDTIWFANGSFTIGIVAVDSDGNGWKCYIGNVANSYDDPDKDAQEIARYGMPTGREIALASFPSQPADKYLR